MDFSATQAQDELSALGRRILTDRVTADRLAELERGGQGFDADLWAELAAAGMLGAALPDSVGGDGFGLAEQCSILAEVGRAVAPVPYLETIVLGAGAIARFGSAGQVTRWAVPAATGRLVITAALAEPGDDDPRAPSVRAERAERTERGGRERAERAWRLRGTKTTVPAGLPAALFLVPAATRSGTAPRHRRDLRAPARRHRAGARADRRVRQDPAAVRPADRGVPGGGAAAGRRLHRRRGDQADDVAGRLAARVRPAV